jgi:hypothetical protein
MEVDASLPTSGLMARRLNILNNVGAGVFIG